MKKNKGKIQDNMANIMKEDYTGCCLEQRKNIKQRL